VFFQLPHGLFAVSLMTTLGPELATAVSRSDWPAFRRQFSTGLRLMGLVVLPAAVGYMVLAHPIVSALLERGALSASRADLTADVLATFALGLFGFSVYLYALRGFYTVKDTRTPFLLNAGENAVNIVLALALYPSLGVQGLGLAYAGAYTISAIVALVVLGRRVGGLDDRKTLVSVARTALAAVVMGLVVAVTAGQIGDDHGGGAVVRVLAGVAVGAPAYGLVLVALGADEARELLARLRNRRPPPAPPQGT
jgi:putative peptidoglycan lipid II flippase